MQRLMTESDDTNGIEDMDVEPSSEHSSRNSMMDVNNLLCTPDRQQPDTGDWPFAVQVTSPSSCLPVGR
jgi:hypothetical protein